MDNRNSVISNVDKKTTGFAILLTQTSLSILGGLLHFVSIANFCKKSIITRKRTIFEGSFSLHYS